MNEATDLKEILAESWRLLLRATADKRSPMRTPVIATVRNELPEQRTVVLRKAETGTRQLLFYTDARAGKVEALGQNEWLHWLFYHPKKQIQLRALGTTELHRDDTFAERHWKNMSVHGRKAYATTAAPGSSLSHADDGLAAAWKEASPTATMVEEAYGHFVVGVCTIQQLEYLKLDREGHRRAQFKYDGAQWNASWLVP
ncbi:MAG: pyridoxamine 5'-phosphate oxidase family protein [Bacteroidota bacterium]